MNTSFPVHPTQIYESLVGLVLLVAPALAEAVHALPRAGLLPLRVRVRVPALPPRALARRRRARQLRADARRARLHPALPPAPGARVRLRHLARHREQARAHDRPRARAPAARRRLSAPQARELRADRPLPAVDEPAHRRRQRAGGLVLLRAVLGRRAQAPATGHEPGGRGQHPAPAGRVGRGGAQEPRTTRPSPRRPEAPGRRASPHVP